MICVVAVAVGTISNVYAYIKHLFDCSKFVHLIILYLLCMFQAMEDSKNVAQENDKARFFKECSHVSQKLEESFLDLLISNGQSEVEDASEQPSRDDPTVDVTDALSCIRRIAFNSESELRS